MFLCVSALPCLALLDFIKDSIFEFILISVVLVPPCCVHRDRRHTYIVSGAHSPHFVFSFLKVFCFPVCFPQHGSRCSSFRHSPLIKLGSSAGSPRVLRVRLSVKFTSRSSVQPASCGYPKPAGRSSVKFAGRSKVKFTGCRSLKSAGWGSLMPAGCSDVKSAGCGSLMPAGRSDIKPAGCGSPKPTGRSEVKPARPLQRQAHQLRLTSAPRFAPVS